MTQQLPPPTTPQVIYIQQPGARNGLGTAALCLGIAGCVLGLIPLLGIFAIALGAVGATLAACARGRFRRREATNKGVTIAGLVTSLAAVGLGVIGVVIVSNVLDDTGTYLDCLAESGDPDECD